MKIFLLGGSGLDLELEYSFVYGTDKFSLYICIRCICGSVLDIVNKFLFKNSVKSLKGHLAASFLKDKKILTNIKKSGLGYLCHSH